MKFDWKRFAEVAQTLGPLVLIAVNPALAPIAGKITQAIVEAEQIKGASGADKAKHVKQIVKLGVEAANSTGAGLDTAAIDQSIGDGITAVISTIKVVEAKGKVKVVATAPTPA